MKKSVMLFISCYFFIIVLSGTALAQNSTQVKQVTFQDMMKIYYDNMDETSVTGKNGDDITEQFLATTLPYYQSGNFEMIRSYFHNNVDHIYLQKEEVIGRQKMGITKAVTGYESRELKNSDGHKCEVMIYVGGTIIYDPNTGYILSAYNPKLIRTDYTANGSEWTFQDKDITTSSSISTDKFTAYFNVKYHCIGRYYASPLDYDFGWPELTISSQAG